jgi:hypothetical protein
MLITCQGRWEKIEEQLDMTFSRPHTDLRAPDSSHERPPMKTFTTSAMLSVFKGKRMKNGWKNSGLPWTCDLDPEKMRLPSTPKAEAK